MSRESVASVQIPGPGLSAGQELLGLDDEVRALYARLATAGPLPIAEVDGRLLASLLRSGLVVRTEGMVEARAPRRPLEAAAQSYTQLAARIREISEELTDVWNASRGADVGIDIATGAVALQEYADLVGSAKARIAALTMAPRQGRPIGPAPGVFEVLARGVEVRVVYDSRLLESPKAIEVAETCMAAGEQARVFPGVPINLVIVDDVVSANVTSDADEEVHVANIRNRRLVEALRSVFESYWQLSLPLAHESLVPDASEDFRHLVRLLSIGLTDRAIARELGVSERTVGRRVTRLQELLGADTRFQLGLQIARHGWV
ncbi:Homeodomain-like domain-containing protein [Micromonospora viridifaciens]|uniref:Homeodomain-like domain-containing protein n=1 Tax=Micromonospora viridifaciens TaxID=1881 RepID=A0A1C4WPQ9_MICVI|nr:helix-turn-helix domain-containing protein [Micromonospora viridifaciens]SCE98190.1 Homeodomain-like domain-containing protein [Micromonospora viridifaciens]